MSSKSLFAAMALVLVCLLALTAWLYSDNQETAAQAQQAKADLENITTELNSISAEKDNIESMLETASTEKDQLQSKLDSTSTSLDQAKIELAALRHLVNTLQAKKDQLQDQLKEKAEEEINSKLYGIIFTTKVTENKRPANSLEQISINEEILYIYARWRLSLKTHYYTVKIFDSSETLIFQGKYTLNPDSQIWNTWPGYYINKYLDTPGLWRVEIYLDGRKVGEKSITVTP